MQLHERYGDRVHGISLNVDYEGDEEGPSEQLVEKIVSKLKQLNITCENVIASDAIDEVLSEFDIFSLPAVLIYDAQSELHKRFDGSVSYEEQVIPAVKQLLEAN